MLIAWRECEDASTKNLGKWKAIYKVCQKKRRPQLYWRCIKSQQTHVVTNSATISAVDELIRQNRRITTREITGELSISKGTVHHIIHKKLGYDKVCAQWVPKNLSKNQNTVENECLPDPAISTLKPSTSFLRPGISVSMPMAIIYSCTAPHEL
ncbi:hypothetical protein AVEN_115111-1 [Araneus ventricosus]|uniref:Histone-lysine N-methyltransferase SETMAR n=1 Tax=Araneus ventricosus TaxID=182803 RepID=A0A4Y1ZX90_ARAVE|nr:hypothetical protein AVEN_115111-1 [Araneus ventricosus]